MFRVIGLLAILVASACGDEKVVERPFVDLSGVEPQFRPTATPIEDLIGVAQSQLSTDPAVRAFTLSAFAQAGIRHVRGDLLWNVVEPTRGARDFSAYRADVDDYAGVGTTELPILCYGNPWANATPGSTTVPPDDPADFAAYAGAAATALHLPAYEIWNEPNLGFRFWQPREQPQQYGTLVADAAAKIRGADRHATVLLGGLIYHGQLGTEATYFLERMYREQPKLAGAYDVLAIHPYKRYPPNVAPEHEDASVEEVSLPRMIERLRTVMQYYGDDPLRPIWATEVGWPTYQMVDEERQARWLVRALLLLAGAGVERVYLYTLFDGPNPTAFPPEDAFGLFHYDDPSDGTFAPTPKLGWQALGVLQSIAGPLAVHADVTAQLAGAPPDTFAYRLTDPTGQSARQVLVIWRADDDAPPVDVTVPIAPVEVDDMLGAQLATSTTVAISGRPVYVIEAR